MMRLYKYDKTYIGLKANHLGFIRDTFEKVIRLLDILSYLNTNPLLKDSLALKGGTAINLTIFQLPRLSVDLDLDYIITSSKDMMLKQRGEIFKKLNTYMVNQGYTLNPKTKNPHSLDSFVYDYIGVSGNKDHIKVEINYSLRAHIDDLVTRDFRLDIMDDPINIQTLSKTEIFASKINALLSRAAARDLYDVYRMISDQVFSSVEMDHLRKSIVFYQAITSKNIDKSFDTTVIERISKRKIKTDLLPVLHKSDSFDLEVAKNKVKNFIINLMKLSKNEVTFLSNFEKGIYSPELIFIDNETLRRVKDHPMALWKTRRGIGVNS